MVSCDTLTSSLKPLWNWKAAKASFPQGRLTPETDTATRQISSNCSKDRNKGCPNTYDVFLEDSTAFIKVSPALEFYDMPLKEPTNKWVKGIQSIRVASLPKGFVH